MIVLIIFTTAIFIFVSLVLLRTVLRKSNRKLKEGIKLESTGRYHEALSIYDFLLKNGNSSPELRWKIANTALKVNLVSRAQKELAILIETKTLPEHVSVLAVKTLMAECYSKLGQVKEAFAELLEISKSDQDSITIIFELAKIYAGQKMTGKAITLAEKCLRQNPNDYEINYFLGKAYLDQGNSTKAAEHLERCIRAKFYDQGRVNYYLGILYYSQQKFNIALQNFTQVLKLRPNDNRLLAESHNLIALCYKEKGLVDEAIINFEKSQIYSELLPKDAKSKKALYNQGVLLYKKGQYKKALEKFYKLKMLDYKYKDVDKIIKTITLKLRNGEQVSDNVAEYITENPLLNILKRGLLYSNVKFSVEAVEMEAERSSDSLMRGGFSQGGDSAGSRLSYSTVQKFNVLPSKKFKDIARKLMNVIGFYIRSEPKFLGDSEYIDGNAINFYVVPINNQKIKKEILISIRRYKDPVSELSVSRFVEWMEENGMTQGVFIASSTFSTQALKVMGLYPNVKFIDRSGLGRMLWRVR